MSPAPSEFSTKCTGKLDPEYRCYLAVTVGCDDMDILWRQLHMSSSSSTNCAFVPWVHCTVNFRGCISSIFRARVGGQRNEIQAPNVAYPFRSTETWRLWNLHLYNLLLKYKRYQARWYMSAARSKSRTRYPIYSVVFSTSMNIYLHNLRVCVNMYFPQFNKTLNQGKNSRKNGCNF